MDRPPHDRAPLPADEIVRIAAERGLLPDPRGFARAVHHRRLAALPAGVAADLLLGDLGPLHTVPDLGRARLLAVRRSVLYPSEATVTAAQRLATGPNAGLPVTQSLVALLWGVAELVGLEERGLLDRRVRDLWLIGLDLARPQDLAPATPEDDEPRPDGKPGLRASLDLVREQAPHAWKLTRGVAPWLVGVRP